MPEDVVVEAVSRSDGLEDEWDVLAEQVGAPPFLRPGWFAAFGDAFGLDGLRVLVTRDGAGTLTGVLPVVRRSQSVGSPTNWHSPGYDVVAGETDVARALCQALVREGAARIDMAFMRPGSQLHGHLLDAVRQTDHRVLARPLLRSPELELTGDFAGYEATRPSKLRREIRRRRRKLGEDHGETVVHFDDGRIGLDRLLREGFAVEGSGWKTAQGTAIGQDPRTERFYREIARWAAGRNWLQLGFVRVGDTPVAFSFSLVYEGVVSVLKIGYDPRFARYAVGTLLTREAIARAYELGHRRYDFLGNEDPYKLAWTDRAVERVRVQAFPRSPLGVGHFVLWRHGRPAALRGRELVAVRRGS
jgi:CelD/BcsL family acetyltransferase involved in cellulose biosynthesis